MAFDEGVQITMSNLIAFPNPGEDVARYPMDTGLYPQNFFLNAQPQPMPMVPNGGTVVPSPSTPGTTQNGGYVNAPAQPQRSRQPWRPNGRRNQQQGTSAPQWTKPQTADDIRQIQNGMWPGFGVGNSEWAKANSESAAQQNNAVAGATQAATAPAFNSSAITANITSGLTTLVTQYWVYLLIGGGLIWFLTKRR